MKTSTVNLVKLEPSEGMHLKNKITGEVYAGFVCPAKSLTADDFDEITEEEYQRIIAELESENGENKYM